MTTGGDTERSIIYIVQQRTTAKLEKIPQVVKRFKRELALQFGSSCEVTLVEVVDVPAGERVLRTRSGTPLNADTDSSRESEVDSPPTARERRRAQRQ